MELERVRESLLAAQLCLRAGFVNSAASRGYYAMFQAAHVALEIAGVGRGEWSHAALHAAFASELIRRRKSYPVVYRDYLSSALFIRQQADYSNAGVSAKIAQRLVRRAAALVAAVEKEAQRGTISKRT